MTQSWNDLSPLHIASCLFGKGSASMVNLLLEYGADPLQGIEYSQFIRMKQLPQESQQQQRKVKRQVGSDAKKIPEEIKETLKGKMVYPLDLGVAVRNRDVVALFLSRMSKESVIQNQFCLVIRQDLEILGALLDAGADVLQTNQRYSSSLLSPIRSWEADRIFSIFLGAAACFILRLGVVTAISSDLACTLRPRSTCQASANGKKKTITTTATTSTNKDNTCSFFFRRKDSPPRSHQQPARHGDSASFDFRC